MRPPTPESQARMLIDCAWDNPDWTGGLLRLFYEGPTMERLTAEMLEHLCRPIEDVHVWREADPNDRICRVGL